MDARAPTAIERVRLDSRAGVVLVALLLAFTFLGTRSIWDPDEGRYTNVALNMAESGDWVNPKRNHEVGHWTKPPVTYWLIAASTSLLGRNPWAARLPFALAYLLCIWGTWRVARRLVPGVEATAAIVFATMLVPFGASAFVSADFPLAAFQTVAMVSYVEARFGERGRSGRWLLLMWVAFAVAFLTKGPPALLPLLGVLAHEWLVPERRSGPIARWSQILVFVLLAAPWYVAVIQGHPGLLRYFLGTEVVGRLTSGEFRRNGQWYGWALIYGPTLLLGTAPWTGALLRRVRSLFQRLALWRDQEARNRDAAELLLVLWFFVPLLVFCVARSRLPLYLLPLFVPIAVVVALQREREGKPSPRPALVLGWVALLLGLRLASAWWPTHKDAGAWAAAILERAGAPVNEVVFVDDMARYGLRLHLDAEVEKISLAPVLHGGFNPTYDDDLVGELAEREQGAVFVAREGLWPQVSAKIRAAGFVARPLGTPFHGRVIFAVSPAGEPAATPPRR